MSSGPSPGTPASDQRPGQRSAPGDRPGLNPSLSLEQRLGLNPARGLEPTPDSAPQSQNRWWRWGGSSDDIRRRLVGPQLLFGGLLVLAVSGFAVSGSGRGQLTELWAGLSIVVLATVGAFVVPWHRLGPEWGAALPILDTAALGLCRAGLLPEGGTLSSLIFVIAVWTVTILRAKGVVVATLASILAVSVPSLVFEVATITAPQIVRYSLLPLTVLVISWLAMDLYQRLEDSSTRLVSAFHQQRAMHAEIERRARLIGAVGDSLNVGILVLDVDGNDVLWNGAQVEIHTLVSPPDNEDKTEAGHLLFGADRHTPIPPEQRPAYRAAHGEIFENLLVFAGEPGPAQRALSVSAIHVMSSEHKHEATVLVFYDITKMQTAIRERDEFVATVSHELRTPLTSIIGYADLAIDELDDDSVMAEYLGVVARNARQLLVLVEDLLVEQQIRIGEHDRDRQPTRLSDLVQEAVESLQLVARRKSQTLTASTVETPVVPLERSRMLQVLDNLITNAIKYTQPGGTILVQTRSEAGSVSFAVIDNGPGMEPADAAQMFAPFFRAKAALRSGTGGAGIGLAVCRSIVEAHGGSVAVDTAPGQGTTIRVVIPCPTQGENS